VAARVVDRQAETAGGLDDAAVLHETAAHALVAEAVTVMGVQQNLLPELTPTIRVDVAAVLVSLTPVGGHLR